MEIYYICIALLILAILILAGVFIQQHKLKQIQKQNQAIDYIIYRMKKNVRTQDKDKLDNIINTLRGIN